MEGSCLRLRVRRLRCINASCVSQTVVQRQHNISSVDPTAYSARFLEFMSGIFL